ncbi:hypothetical protein [Colwellia sp. TT2012]|uniref:hypothetical protein n=1 Tax=Colwellia sp. TT2012 TaxID=1720342 RepID=UPI000A6808B2|nr:hypothetical protein [Colwellia sp. TT2012]
MSSNSNHRRIIMSAALLDLYQQNAKVTPQVDKHSHNFSEHPPGQSWEELLDKDDNPFYILGYN